MGYVTYTYTIINFMVCALNNQNLTIQWESYSENMAFLDILGGGCEWFTKNTLAFKSTILLTYCSLAYIFVS
jgi:hypothetical protein